jgi:hypothetical protein
MTDMTDASRTEPLEEQRATRSTDDFGATGTHRDRTDPVEVVKDPDNRAKLLLVIAAATLLNLILLVAVLASVMGDDFQQVVVDGEQCVIGEQDGENILYCQR